MQTEVLGQGPEPDLPEFTSIGGYRLVQQLGEGGMGVVHLALDRSGKAVAIKVLRPHVAADPAARGRLAREVETLSRVRHPNVAPIIDQDVEGPLPYIVTRYIAGPPLDRVIEEHGPMRGPALLQLGRGLAAALHGIHEAGVVHRDVKPGNVLMLDGEPILIDFGIAHAADDVRLTRTGLVMGTPGYLSPEIVEGAEVTESTDWWGWAVTLGFAASGRPPFGKGTMESVLSRVVRGDADLSGVDPALVPLLDAALSPYPQDRPTDAEVIRALETYAAGGAVTDVLRTAPRRSVPETDALAAPATAVLPPVAPAPGTSGPGRPVVAPAPGRSGVAPAPPYADPAAPSGRTSGRATGEPRPPQYVTPRPASPARPAVAPPPSWTQEPEWSHDPSWSQEPGDDDGDWSYRGAAGAATPPPPRAPMATDPRIGRAARRGVLIAVASALVATATAYPAFAVIAGLLWSVVARTADRSVTSLVLRRYTKGARSSDLAMAVLASPMHLVTGVIAALAGALIPASVGLAGIFATLLGVNLSGAALPVRITHAIALGVGMALAIMMAWWGPGGSGLRRGSRSLARGLAPNQVGAQVVAGLAIAATAFLVTWMVLQPGLPVWWPFGGAPSIFTSLTQAP